MTSTFDGKVAIVTGAGSGIGRAIVELLHARGAAVLAADISGAQEEIARNLGQSCLPMHADVTEEQDVRSMVSVALEKFGQLDVVVNNAGMAGGKALTGDYDPQEYERVLAVNARSVFLSMKYSLPHLASAGGGAIVNIASIAAGLAWPFLAPYTASKAAVVAMTRTAAAEYGPMGVRVNCVCPGAIDTPMLRLASEESLRARAARTPLARIGEPAELAKAVAFLASTEASFITGATLTVDGGYAIL